MVPSTIRQIFTTLTAAMMFTMAECDTPHRTSRLPSKEEEDMERYKKPICIIFSAIFLSVAPLLVQFIHCLFTDPAVPIVYREMKLRGMEMMTQRFGLLDQNVDRYNGAVPSSS